MFLISSVVVITKDSINVLLSDGGTHRKQFSASSGVQKNKISGDPTFSTTFDKGLVRHFLEGTGLQMKWGATYGHFYCFLRDHHQINAAER